MNWLKNREGYPFTNGFLIRLLLPVMAELALVNMIGIIDSIMVSVIGEEAVSAVSLVDTTFCMLTLFFTSLANGAAIVCGQFLGAGRKKEACDSADQLFLFTVLASVAAVVVMMACRTLIFRGIYGSIEADVEYNANVYMTVVAFSIPFLSLYNAGSAMFRMMEDSATPMKMSLLMNGIHIPLNAVLLYGFHFGIEGAAISTLISRGVTSILMIALLRNQGRLLHLSRRPVLRFRWDLLKRIFHIGVPNGIENGIFQLGTILLLSLTSTFGTAAIAANAVSNTVAVFQTLAGEAVGYVMLTVAAHCVGAGKYEQVRFYAKKLLGFSYLMVAGINLLILFLMPVILRIYHLSPSTGELTRQIIIMMGLFSVTLWPVGFNLPNVLRAANDVKFCLWSSIICVWLFRVVFSFILGQYLGMGILGVKIAMVIDWAVRFTLVLLRYVHGKWQRQMAVGTT